VTSRRMSLQRLSEAEAEAVVALARNSSDAQLEATVELCFRCLDQTHCKNLGNKVKGKSVCPLPLAEQERLLNRCPELELSDCFDGMRKLIHNALYSPDTQDANASSLPQGVPAPPSLLQLLNVRAEAWREQLIQTQVCEAGETAQCRLRKRAKHNPVAGFHAPRGVLALTYAGVIAAP